MMPQFFNKLDHIVRTLEGFATQPPDDVFAALADISKKLPLARREVQNLPDEVLDEMIYGQEGKKHKA